MNLADALGIVPWQSCDGQVSASPMQKTNRQDIWCTAEGLEDFWMDASDSRWRLLLAILNAIGHNEETVAPLDSVDADMGGIVLAFGATADSAICLPSLDAMLKNGGLKQQAWQILCHNQALLFPT